MIHPVNFEEFLGSRLGEGIETTLKQVRLNMIRSEFIDSSVQLK